MLIGIIIAIYQFYSVQERVAMPVKDRSYYTIVVRQEKVKVNLIFLYFFVQYISSISRS